MASIRVLTRTLQPVRLRFGSNSGLQPLRDVLIAHTRSTKVLSRIAAAGLCFFAAIAHAQITGTVTNKTDGKPAAGDNVVLLDVQAGMAEIAHATTDAKGHYSLNKPGNGPYLVRVTHQGAAYFIAAPETGGSGDIPVYDSAPKVEGISIEADVLELETDNGQLKVNERYFVHNTSSPPRTEYSAHSLEIVLPAGAVVDGAAARRPTGLPTSTNVTPTSQKGHFTFDFPIQPDEGDKDTLFQVTYHIPYSGKFTFRPQLELPADNVAVLMPKSMTFDAGAGLMFQPVNEDPNIQTYVGKNATLGKPIEFTVSGTGSMPREGQGQPAADSGAQSTATPGSQPGGGIGNPIDTPDPLSKYKWWILAGFALLLSAAAAFLLRKPAVATAGGPALADAAVPVFSSPAAKNTALLNVLKEELFAVESEKLSGKMSLDEYSEVKSALETVLKRALNRK
jgi:hypothetical protein